MIPRLNRLFAADGKCLDVAIDHGFFNERSFLNGIESLPKAIRTVVDAAPDAVQLPPGGARVLQAMPGAKKPALVMRTDVANVYPPVLPHTLFSELVEDAVEGAVRLDAACVVANLLLLPSEPLLHRDCLRNVARLRPVCERYAMPLMVEPLVMRGGVGGYLVDGDLDKILPLVRQAAELGADVIKADPCDDIEEYHRVVEVANGLPVLVRGGGRASDEVVLERTRAVMAQGARGIVYGRNVVQHPDPSGMVRRLMGIVHADPKGSKAL